VAITVRPTSVSTAQLAPGSPVHPGTGDDLSGDTAVRRFRSAAFGGAMLLDRHAG
jgi:hypothetical protein